MIQSYKNNSLRRLKLIEGQVRGLHKMIEDERYCADILHQLSAAQSALKQVGDMVMRNYLETCVTKAIKNGKSKKIYGEVMDVIKEYSR